MMTKYYGWIAATLILCSRLVFAADNPIEATSSSSSGNFDIELIVPPLAQIGFPLALTNIDFGGFDETFGFQDQLQGFCVFHNTAAVTLEAGSSSNSGRFMLAHASAVDNVNPGDNDGIEYLVEVFGSGTPITQGTLIAGVPSQEFTAANARQTDVPNCSDGTANMELRLRLVSDINFEQKTTGVYSDELTLTVRAE